MCGKKELVEGELAAIKILEITIDLKATIARQADIIRRLATGQSLTDVQQAMVDAIVGVEGGKNDG